MEEPSPATLHWIEQHKIFERLRQEYIDGVDTIDGKGRAFSLNRLLEDYWNEEFERNGTPSGFDQEEDELLTLTNLGFRTLIRKYWEESDLDDVFASLDEDWKTQIINEYYHFWLLRKASLFWGVMKNEADKS